MLSRPNHACLVFWQIASSQPAWPQAPTATARFGDLSNHEIYCFCNGVRGTPDRIVRMDNNGAILAACQGGRTIEQLRAGVVAVTDSQIRLLQDSGLLRKEEGGALTPSASEKNPGFCYLSPSAFQILATSYPTKVFSVRLWGADTWPNYYPSTSPDSWDRLCGGHIDEVFHRNGDKPAGFDVDVPPFSRISIGDLFQVSPDYYSKENLGCPPEYLSTTINQVLDGLVFLKPLASYQGGTVSPKCFDAQFMKTIARRMGGEGWTTKDLYKYLLETRPILGKSLEPLIKAESER